MDVYAEEYVEAAGETGGVAGKDFPESVRSGTDSGVHTGRTGRIHK